VYTPYNKDTASREDRIAWVLCQIIDDDAPMRWPRYRGVAECIARNRELMADLAALAAPDKAPAISAFPAMQTALRSAWHGDKAKAGAYTELAAQKLTEAGQETLAKYLLQALAEMRGEREPVYVHANAAEVVPAHACQQALQRSLDALVYHRAQTRPIAQSDEVIDFLREALRETPPAEVRKFYLAPPDLAAELLECRQDAELLAWVFEHPETCAEELEDAVRNGINPRTAIEARRTALRRKGGAA
jgi:hypothetical protein